jgi:hypothetical protein
MDSYCRMIKIAESSGLPHDPATAFREFKCSGHPASTGWPRRSNLVKDAVASLQKIINDAKTGLNHAANGFFTAC